MDESIRGMSVAEWQGGGGDGNSVSHAVPLLFPSLCPFSLTDPQSLLSLQIATLHYTDNQASMQACRHTRTHTAIGFTNEHMDTYAQTVSS